MDKTYLYEAFKSLDVLNEEDFNLDNKEEMSDFKSFMDSDDSFNDFNIIDPEAETEDELKDSYEGNVILDCQICHSKIYKDPSEVEIDDDAGLANLDEECPYCYSTDGFKIIGQVAPYCDECEEDHDDEDDDFVEESLTEGVFNKLRGRKNKNTVSNADWAAASKLTQYEKDYYDGINNSRHSPGGEPFSNMKKQARDEFERSLSSPMKKRQKRDFDKYKAELDAANSKAGLDTSTTKEECFRSTKMKREAFEKVNIETETDTMEMTSDPNGKVTVTTQPKDANIGKMPVIAPVDAEVKAEINSNGIEDEPEDDSIDYDINDFSEEEFDEIGESYFKENYSNVKSFKTTGIKEKGNTLTLEGIIKFNSGNEKKTSFIFEAKDATKRGKVRFIGENCQICKGKKAFTLTGKVNSGKFITESLNYNYTAKDNSGKSTRIHGTIRKK